MRALAWIRNYAILVFFLVMVGGVLLLPRYESKDASVQKPTVATDARAVS
jgi:hypothetical protein